jgi:predicted metal-dependent hydrolase
MKAATQHQIRLGNRRVDYRVVSSHSARRLRIRVGPNGVEVLKPNDRTASDVEVFLLDHARWVLEQVRRTDRLGGIIRRDRPRAGHILFRGHPTRVRIEATISLARSNAVALGDGEIIIRKGARSSTPPAQSLETWLRKQARHAIAAQLAALSGRLRQHAGRVYVMGQRTKWGNCSSRRNLSFNWRLILAPDFVLRYLVTHEAVHLAVPDHSRKFWLTVQSLCPETERAKQWLSANGTRLLQPLLLSPKQVRG